MSDGSTIPFDTVRSVAKHFNVSVDIIALEHNTAHGITAHARAAALYQNDKYVTEQRKLRRWASTRWR